MRTRKGLMKGLTNLWMVLVIMHLFRSTFMPQKGTLYIFQMYISQAHMKAECMNRRRKATGKIKIQVQFDNKCL